MHHKSDNFNRSLAGANMPCFGNKTSTKDNPPTTYRGRWTPACNLLLLTVLSAHRDYGISSLPRRILDLKQAGVEIKDGWVEIENKRAYKEYYL